MLPVADVKEALEQATIASCECGTKTNDHLFHTHDCLYRILTEAMLRITRLEWVLKDVVDWADGLYPYSDDGTSLVPVFQRAKEVLAPTETSPAKAPCHKPGAHWCPECGPL